MNMTVSSNEQTAEMIASLKAPTMAYDVVRSCETPNLWTLESGIIATRALSCLVEPQLGDRILVAADAGIGVIVAIISRQQEATVSLTVANGGDLHVSADSLSFTARRDVELQAETAITLSAPFGAVETVAHNLTLAVQGSVVTVADAIIEQARNVHVSADETIMTHAQIHSVTADQDLFMDADRINMG